MRTHATTLSLLAFWLVCAAGAGAAETKDAKDPKDAKPAKQAFAVRPSVYAPKTSRDPFLAASTPLIAKPGAAAVTTDFNLQGILYHPSKPSAMINNTLVLLNKPVTLPAGPGKLEVKAIEITRNSVKLQVGDQTVDLRLEPAKPSVPAPSAKVSAPATSLAPEATGPAVAAAAPTANKTTDQPAPATPTGGGP